MMERVQNYGPIRYVSVRKPYNESQKFGPRWGKCLIWVQNFRFSQKNFWVNLKCWTQKRKNPHLGPKFQNWSKIFLDQFLDSGPRWGFLLFWVQIFIVFYLIFSIIWSNYIWFYVSYDIILGSWPEEFHKIGRETSRWCKIDRKWTDQVARW